MSLIEHVGGQVLLLAAMFLAITSSTLAVTKHQGVILSMYLRVLIPIVFSKYG